MQGIPPANDTDAEDIVWGLQTAETLWKRGERIDAIVWLRRAAQAAGAAGDDDRALSLARAAAELSDWMATQMSAPPAPLDAPTLAPAEGDAEAGAAEPETPRRPAFMPPEEPASAPRRSARPELPTSPPPSSPMMERAEPAEHQPRTTSVPPADKVHAGMFNPWDDNGPPPPVVPPLPSPPRFTAEEEVITSVRPDQLAQQRADALAAAVVGGVPQSGMTKLPPTVPSAWAEEPKPEEKSPRPLVPADLASVPVDLASVPVDLASVPVDLASVPVDLASVPADLASVPVDLVSVPADLASAPPADAKPARPAPARPPPLPPRALKPRPPVPAAPSAPAAPAPASPPAPAAPPAPASPPASASPPAPTAAAPPAPAASPAPVAPRAPLAPRAPVAPLAPSPPSAPAPWPPPPTPPPPPPPAIAAPAKLELDDVEAFADLPDDARTAFAAAAEVSTLGEGEEVSHFALAYILSGTFDVAATMVDAPAARLGGGAVLRARGTTDEGVPMRLIGVGSGVVATWTDAAVTEAFRTCPWVEEDLRVAADRLQTLVGVTIGPLGERLDASIREQIIGRLTMRTLSPGEVVVSAGEPVPGLLLVGIGELELVDGDTVAGRVGSGEFLFAGEVLGAGAAPHTARAGAGGALILFGDRMIAQELLVTCPPLLEVFAGM